MPPHMGPSGWCGGEGLPPPTPAATGQSICPHPHSHISTVVGQRLDAVLGARATRWSWGARDLVQPSLGCAPVPAAHVEGKVSPRDQHAAHASSNDRLSRNAHLCSRSNTPSSKALPCSLQSAMPCVCSCDLVAGCDPLPHGATPLPLPPGTPEAGTTSHHVCCSNHSPCCCSTQEGGTTVVCSCSGGHGTTTLAGKRVLHPPPEGAASE